MAGFPRWSSSFHDAPLPHFLNIALSFPILLSIVPAAKNLGHLHGGEPFSDDWHEVLWQTVFPNLSRHAKKKITSLGDAEAIVLFSGSDQRYDSSCLWRLDFWRWYGFVLR